MVDKFDSNDWAHLHDCVLDTTCKSFGMVVLRQVFDSLPEYIKEDAYKWGLSDTVVRDNICNHLKHVNYD